MARIINTLTIPKQRSPTCNACPTASATASTIAQRTKEWRSGFATAWKKSNGSGNPLQIGRQIREKAEQKENLKPDSRNLISSCNRSAGGFCRVHHPVH